MKNRKSQIIDGKEVVYLAGNIYPIEYAISCIEKIRKIRDFVEEKDDRISNLVKILIR